jgi:Core-2/I-Branching enzyme
MKIAALILAHHRRDLLAQLVSRLNGPLWNVYIHLDKKTDPAGGFADLPADLLQRYAVQWAGFSTVLAIFALAERALANPTNTHFYLMSGQCFPIKTDDEIEQIVADGGNCMTIVKMPVWHKPLSRLDQFHFNDGYPLPGRLGSRIVNRVARRLEPRSIQRLLRDIEPYAGTTWWLLERDAMRRIVQFVAANPWLLKSYRYSIHADEMFFQTLAVKTSIKTHRECPTFAKWIDGEFHPLSITPEILAEAKRGWHLMARKFV